MVSEWEELEKLSKDELIIELVKARRSMRNMCIVLDELSKTGASDFMYDEGESLHPHGLRRLLPTPMPNLIRIRSWTTLISKPTVWTMRLRPNIATAQIGNFSRRCAPYIILSYRRHPNILFDRPWVLFIALRTSID